MTILCKQNYTDFFQHCMCRLYSIYYTLYTVHIASSQLFHFLSRMRFLSSVFHSAVNSMRTQFPTFAKACGSCGSHLSMEFFFHLWRSMIDRLQLGNTMELLILRHQITHVDQIYVFAQDWLRYANSTEIHKRQPNMYGHK